MKILNLCRLILAALISLTVLIPSFTFASPPAKANNAAKANQTVEIKSVTDKASILSKTEIQQLTSKIQSVEQKHGVQLGVVIQSTLNGQSPSKAANALLKSNFSGGQNGGMVLLIAMDSRDWHISFNTPMSERITDNGGFPYLQNRVVALLSDGDFNGAFNKYVDTVDSLLTYYEQNGQPYDPSAEFNPMALAAAIVISIFIGVMIRSSLIDSMSNVRHAVEASAYLVQNSVRLTENQDTFLFMNVVRSPKRRDSSSSHDSDGDGDSHGGGGKF